MFIKKLGWYLNQGKKETQIRQAKKPGQKIGG